jgi:pyrroline-5-carboxylate reductase
VKKIQPLVQPADQIVRAVPLPCTAIHAGPVVIYPDQGDAVSRAGDLFNRIGRVIAVSQEDHLETLAVITSLMAPYYAFVEAAAAWGTAQGIERKDAAAYTASMFGGLSRIAESEDRGDMQGFSPSPLPWMRSRTGNNQKKINPGGFSPGHASAGPGR